MTHPSSKNLLLTLLGISVILIAAKFFTIMSFPDAHTLDRDKMQKILPGQTFSQKFIANRDNLHIIQILFRTPGIKDGDVMTAKLADETCSNIIEEGALEKPFLNTDNVYLFNFPRIKDSMGKKYCLLLSYRTSNDSTKYLRFFTTEASDTSLLFTNMATSESLNGQALSLRTVYRSDHWWQDLGELNDRISQYKPWFLKDFFIGTIMTLFVVLSIAMVALLITVRVGDKQD